MWNDANKILPEKDGDYLVFIKGAELPCVLSFHSDCGVFYDENHECYYNITHWMSLPEKPEATQAPVKLFFRADEFCITFSIEEAIVYRELLHFLLAFYNLPGFMESRIDELFYKFCEVLGDKK